MINEAYIEQKSRKLLKKIKSAETKFDFKGAVYYVSADGSDFADGLTPQTALKTLEAASNIKNLKYGDAVLFRRGDVFRGHLQIHQGITYSSYDKGEKPHIYGATENAVNSEWIEVRPCIYALYIPHRKDIGCIVFNFGEEWGYKRYLKEDTDVILDKDFYHDIANNTLYLYSEKGNPSKRWFDIELCRKEHIISGLADDVTIDGLVIKYGGSHGISTGSVDYPEGELPVFINCRNFTVRNCEIEWIGGTVQVKDIRWGNGIEIWGGCENHLIENCYFNQCYDAAITQQFQGPCRFPNGRPLQVKNTVMRGNLFDNNTYSYEYFLTERDAITNKPLESTAMSFENVLFENNICRNAGYGWGNQRPDRSSSALIKSWKHFNNAKNFVIRNNIFDRGDYRLIETCAKFDECLPVFENNIYCQYLDKDIICNNQETTKLTNISLKNPVKATGDKKPVLIKAFR